MLIAAVRMRLMDIVTTNSSIVEAPFALIGSMPIKKTRPLKAAQTRNAIGRVRYGFHAKLAVSVRVT